MIRRRAFVFWGAVLAQALFLLVWAGYHEYVRQTAPTVLLRPRPVDPRDLIRGDYMILDYDISDLRFPAGEKPEPGDEVFVVLEKRGELHEVVRSSRKQLAVKPGQSWVRARIDRISEDGRYHAEYGIEQYYVPEGKGTPAFSRLVVEASVSPDHRLNIRRLLLDGKAYP